MYDPMIRHYQRLYKAKPSPEIAKITADSRRRRDRKSSSIGNVSYGGGGSSSNNSLYGLLNTDRFWATSDRRLKTPKADSNFYLNRPSSSHAYLHHQSTRERPPRKKRSQSGRRQLLSSEDETDEMSQNQSRAGNYDGIFSPMRKANSMNALSGNRSGHEGLVRHESLSEKIDSFLDSVHRQQQVMRNNQRMRTMSLTPSPVVGKNVNGGHSVFSAEARSAAYSFSRRTKSCYSPSTLNSSRHMTPVPPKRHQAAQPSMSAPESLLRPQSSANFSNGSRSAALRKQIGGKSVNSKEFNPTNVTSKLLKDRNYQPPRVRKTASYGNNLINGKTRTVSRPLIADQFDEEVAGRGIGRTRSNRRYHDVEFDFECEEDEELYLTNRRAWLDDQAIRGKMRQRAASKMSPCLQQMRESAKHEKESSKDSAYGFSGGETSRLQTREPTPDAWILRGKGRQKLPPSPASTRPKIIPISGSHNGGLSRKSVMGNHIRNANTLPNKTVPLTTDKKQTSSTRDANGIKFLNKVTREILRQGIYSEKGIRRALDNCLSLVKDFPISPVDKESLIDRLRIELGLSSSRNQWSRSRVKTEASSGIPTKMVANPPQRSSSISSTSSNVSKFFSSPKERLKDCDRSQILPREQLLKEVSDLDDSTVKDILKVLDQNQQEDVSKEESNEVTKMLNGEASRKSSNPNSNRILDESMNLSNLNVSFNSCNARSSGEEKQRRQALLVKSFGRINGSKKAMTNDRSLTMPARDQKVDVPLPSPIQTSPGGDDVEDDFNNTPRSSMLYQAEDSDVEDYHDEQFEPPEDGSNVESPESGDHVEEEVKEEETGDENESIEEELNDEQCLPE